MKRHRGTFKPDHPAPYELSRSRLESYLACPACFWLDRARGVKFPGIPGFLLNSNTDRLLKYDFDAYRGKGPHPIMVKAGLSHLRPFAHEDFEHWTNSLHFGAGDQYFNTVHEATQIKFGGGVDDIWENIDTGELHIVDYKSTSQQTSEPKPLDESFLAPPDDPAAPDYKGSYRRQMDMYQWVARRKGFTVSNTGYFVYVDGQHIGETGMLDDSDPSVGWMRFNTAVIPYEGDDRWVEEALLGAKDLLQQHDCPEHSEGCEHGLFIQAVSETLS